jgi:nickel/cobalt exporter
MSISGRLSAKRVLSAFRVFFYTVGLFSALLYPGLSFAHPMGNFSINHYAGIRINEGDVEVQYLIDMAEIPTFQEIQRTSIVPKEGDPGAESYIVEQSEILKRGILLELNGLPVELHAVSQEVLFLSGAAGLPTMKMGFLYRGRSTDLSSGGPVHLQYRDENFRDHAGWKEIIVATAPSIDIVSADVPSTDRSQQLTNYPTDPLNSPPQQLEANITFVRGSAGGKIASSALAVPSAAQASRTNEKGTQPAKRKPQKVERSSILAAIPVDIPLRKESTSSASLNLQGNKQGTPRNAFTELINTRQLSLWIVLFAAAVAFGLGGAHALEPGHGKTLVAAYLVGSRGTVVHAALLGVIVTAAHTAGVFLLGGITLYAQKYIVPEQLYPWLGVISGLTIALVGIYLLLERYLAAQQGDGHLHSHSPGRLWHSHPDDGPGHAHFLTLRALPEGNPGVAARDPVPDSLTSPSGDMPAKTRVSNRQLFALGVTGGIVPCPAALVVLLSAVALHRVGFGLFLIVAFSFGLATVLIMTGMLVVLAGRFASRMNQDGPLLRKWLPMASATAVTVLGFAIAVRALLAAGILQVRL